MFKHILLATDGSDCSAQAADKAVALAKASGASLTAVFASTPYSYLNAEERAKFSDSARKAAEAAFAVIATKAGGNVEFRPVFDEGDSVLDVVLDQIKIAGADLLVVGSHGHSALNRILLGSVAGKLVNASPIPVLVVR